MKIEWLDAYKIGDAVIDAQHQLWFERINGFLLAEDRISLMHCETLMHQYTRVHFKYEETLMRSVRYPEIEQHIGQHNDLLGHFREISSQIANDTLDRAKWKTFLSDWLLNHIRFTDQKLANYVKASG